MDWKIILAVITLLISVGGILYFGNLFIRLLEKMFHNF
jgi:hypothetical protein